MDYAKQTKPVTERQILHESTYMGYVGQSDSHYQNREWLLPGAEGRGKWRVKMAINFSEVR